jgi:hypothetical protein
MQVIRTMIPKPISKRDKTRMATPSTAGPRDRMAARGPGHRFDATIKRGV